MNDSAAVNDGAALTDGAAVTDRAALTVRRVRFEFDDDLDPRWNPRYPECAIAANSVSLLMPFVEPYVVRSISKVTDGLEPELRARAEDFCRQELQHQRQHRRFNDAVTRGHPLLQRIEGAAERTYRWLSRHRSTTFNLAFAAGFETIAFAIARWTEAHFRVLFDGADDTVSTLFLWHLAEEVEHKTVAFDVYLASGGSRLRYLFTALVSTMLLAAFTIAFTTSMLAQQRRLLHPVAWWRLTKWSITLAFEVLSDVFASAMPGHHPSDFSDPVLLGSWLRYFDPETATMPLWTSSEPVSRPA